MYLGQILIRAFEVFIFKKKNKVFADLRIVYAKTNWASKPQIPKSQKEVGPQIEICHFFGSC